MTDTKDNSQTVITSAPGKAIIFGEHAVVYGKTAIAAALDLRCYSKIENNNEDLVKLYLPDINLEKEFSVDLLKEIKKDIKVNVTKPEPISNELKEKILEIGKPLDNFAIEQALLSFLYLYLCISDKISGVTVNVKSFLPVGAGLGSSAAYGVSLASALLTFYNHIDKDSFSTSTDLINQWAFMAEKITHGNPSGIDNSVSTYGKAQCYTKGKLDYLKSFKSLRFILTNTNVPKNTKVQVSKVRDLYDNCPTVITPILDSIQNISERCKELFSESKNDKLISNELEKLIDINHYLLCSLNVGHEKIEKIRQIASNYNLHSKITGGGGGGCMITYVPQDISNETIENVKSELQNNGFSCYDTMIGCIGVQLHIFKSQILDNSIKTKLQFLSQNDPQPKSKKTKFNETMSHQQQLTSDNHLIINKNTKLNYAMAVKSNKKSNANKRKQNSKEI